METDSRSPYALYVCAYYLLLGALVVVGICLFEKT